MDPDGLLGGYSIAFDLVAKEYGWSDDQIMDLPVVRLRQIIAAIHRRQLMERRQAITLNSWMTRQITTFIAAGYMVEKDKPNTALEIAQNLAFDEIEKAQIEESRVRHSEGAVEIVDGIAFDADGNIIPEVPVNLPTWEQTANVFGDPAKWRTQ